MAKKATLMGQVLIPQFNQVFYDAFKPTSRYYSQTYDQYYAIFLHCLDLIIIEKIC